LLDSSEFPGKPQPEEKITEKAESELHKITDYTKPYEFLCKLVVFKNFNTRITGFCEISQYFVKFEPIEDPGNDILLTDVFFQKLQRKEWIYICIFDCKYRFLSTFEMQFNKHFIRF